MKNATKHAATLKSLCRKLIRQQPAGERPQLDPLRAIVLGVLCEECDDRRAQKVMATLEGEFVDINELRVATELELAAMIGHFPSSGDRAVRMRELLMSLFDAEGRLTIDRLAAMNKKDQRTALRALPMMSPFVEGFVLLAGFGQAAVPVDESMRAYLAASGAVEEDSTVEEAQKFLEAHLKADECWPFFQACHAAACHSRPRRTTRRKATSRKRPAKATSRSRARH